MYPFSDNGVGHQVEDEINYLFKLLVVEVECGSSLISDILFLNFNYVSGLSLICILTHPKFTVKLWVWLDYFVPNLHLFCTHFVPICTFFHLSATAAKSAQNGCKWGQIRCEQTKCRLEQFDCQKAFYANMKYTEANIHKFYKSTSQNH